MTNVVLGEVDWNAADSNSKSDFMRLEEGDSIVRVMGNPIQFYVHWVVTPGGNRRKVNSPIDSPQLLRRLEDSGFKRQARWLIRVLDRDDDEFRILEVGPQIYNAIKALYNNKRWGKVTAYDITVNRGPKGRQPLYSTTPNPKEPLPGDLKAKFVEFNDRVNVDKLISPAQASDICELMSWTLEEATPSDSTDDGDEFDFDFE